LIFEELPQDAYTLGIGHKRQGGREEKLTATSPGLTQNNEKRTAKYAKYTKE
jgi:hypothetical protein